MSAEKVIAAILVTISLTGLNVHAEEVLLTFDAAPAFETPQSGVGTVNFVQGDGQWGTLEDGINNNVANDPSEPTPVPIWNPGGWIQPIGTESPSNNRGPVGPNAEGLDPFAVKANIFTGVRVYDDTNWGDVSTATHLTMDVKGSFAGSGGLTALVSHDEDYTLFGEAGSATWWTWGSNASDASVGANPGDVTEWTTILFPINRPTLPNSGNIPPDPGEAGASGNWGPFSTPFETWDLMITDVNAIQITGVTPDTQIDNLGFVLPDTGSPGDFDGDTDVDGADFLDWQRDTSVGSLTDWEDNYGNGTLSASLSAVPEPCSVVLVLGGLLSLLGARRPRTV